MKYLNNLEQFLNEERKHVSDSVLHYIAELRQFFLTIKLESGVTVHIIDLVSQDKLKLEKLEFIMNINPDNFTNHGKFTHNKDLSVIVDDRLTNCSINIQIQLSDKELQNNKISDTNKVWALLSHELNHALEIYQYKINDRDYNFSWILGEKLRKHSALFSKFQYWGDFLHILYLSLNHEMNSRISELYLKVKDIEDLNFVRSEKIYLEAKLMSNFSFETFYKKIISTYKEKGFLSLCEQFCKHFDYKFTNDIEVNKSMLSRITKSINNKGTRMIKKIEGIIKRIEDDRKLPIRELSTWTSNHDINYDDYLADEDENI